MMDLVRKGQTGVFCHAWITITKTNSGISKEGRISGTTDSKDTYFLGKYLLQLSNWG
jgi:hypothetical protein